MASGDTTSGEDGVSRAIADLEAKTRALFSVLESLGTEQTTQETQETKALHDFVSAESSLIEAGTALAGPSPNFLAPSWEGASDPKRASYRKSFEPIIRKALAELTVDQLEGLVLSDELMADLKLQFEQSATDLNVFSGTPTDADLETLFLEWMADSVIAAGPLLNATRQKAIQNALIKMVITNRANLAAWQKAPTGTGGTATGGLDYVWTSFIEPTITQALKDSGSTIDVSKETDSILNALSQTFKKLTGDQSGDEEAVRAWIQTTILNLVQGPELTDDKKEELVADLEDEVTRLFPQPDRITFYNTFSTLLEQQLYDPSLLGPSAGKSARNVSGMTPTDPNAALAAATAAAKALGDNVQKALDDLNLAKSKLANAGPTASRATKARLVQAVDAKQDALDSLTEQLDQANIDVAEAQAKVAEDPIEAKLLKDRAAAAADVATQIKDLQDQLDGLDDGDEDAKADLENQLAEARKNLADLTKQSSATKKSSDGGLKGLLAGFAAENQISDPTKVVEWQSKVKEEIRKAISKVLTSMSEHGVQGRLLSTTYDYQVVTRVSEYSKAALAQLTTDLDVEIPKNADLALTAAQKVTSAMVNLREFSESLDGLVDGLKGEADSGGKGSARGSGPNIIASLVTGGQFAGRYSIKDLPGVGRALFLSEGHPKPAIKQAEYQAVRLAAGAAGLKTSLQRLLDTEKNEAISSLQALTQAYSTLFQSETTEFSKTATTFFESLGTYIDKRFAFENDQSDLAALRKATVELGDLMDQGVLDYLPSESRKS